MLAQGRDLTIVAWGYMVLEARKAIDALKADGIACGLVDAYSLPLADDFLDAIGAGEGTRLLVVEDNYAGGIGSAVATAAAARGNVHVTTLTPVRMPKSGRTADDVLAFVGIDCGSIVQRVKAILGKA